MGIVKNEDTGVWLGIKQCGCVVAVCKAHIAKAEHVEEAKLEWLASGLSVLYATRDDWQNKYVSRSE